jgi:hypothetical protein
MYKEGLHFLYILIVILIGLFILEYIIRKFKSHKIEKKKNISFLNYAYMTSFSISSGILIYFGLAPIIKLFNEFIPNYNLSILISSTIILAMCLMYAELFRQILEETFSQKIVIDGWTNVVAYLLGRIIIISVIFFIFDKYFKKGKNPYNKLKHNN